MDRPSRYSNDDITIFNNSQEINETEPRDIFHLRPDTPSGYPYNTGENLTIVLDKFSEYIDNITLYDHNAPAGGGGGLTYTVEIWQEGVSDK